MKRLLSPKRIIVIASKWRSSGNQTRLRSTTLVATLIVLLLGGITALGSCGNSEEDENRGTIVKVEAQQINGQLGGFSEYTYQGAWDSNVTYKPGDSVIYNGAFWRTGSGGSGQVPSFSSGSWTKIDAVKYLKEEWHHSHNYSLGYEGPYSTLPDATSTADVTKITTYDAATGINCSKRSGTYQETFGDIGPGALGRDVICHYLDCENCETTYWQDDGPWNYCEPYAVSFGQSGGETTENKTAANWVIGETFSYSIPENPNSSPAPGVFTGSGNRVEEFKLESPKFGAQALQAAAKDADAWEPGWDAYAWLGNWSGGSTFTFTGQAVRFWITFPCVPEDAELEFTYRVWPIGGDEVSDGKDEKETKSVKELEVEEQEDGSKWIKEEIEAKDGYHKRLVKVVMPGSCGGDGPGSPGNNNGPGTGSMWWWVSLGKRSGGISVGRLWVQQSALTTSSVTPKALRYDRLNTPGVQVLRDSFNAIRQIMAPETFVDVVVLNAYSYEIRFYDPTDADEEFQTIAIGNPGDPGYFEFQAPTGFYTATGIPFSVWKVENPDGASAYNHLKITHTFGQADEEYLFEQNGNTWSLDQGDGLKTEELTKTTLPSGDEQVIKVIKDGNGVPSYKVKEVSRFFVFGKRLIERIEDPNGATLTTTWTYYENAATDGGAYGHLKQVVNANGSWERYEYDSEGRETKMVSTYLDAAPNASESQSRVFTTTYSATSTEKTATIIESALGQEVGRRYGIKKIDGSEIRNIVCTVPGASATASTNLTTVTKYIVGGAFNGKVSSVKHPDGMMIIYNYASNASTVTTIEWRGQPNGSGTAIVAGTKSTRVEDTMGRLMSQEIKDVATNLVIESYQITDRDEFGRPTLIQYSDGTTEEKTYTCCGVDSEKNRNGETTSYTYDDLKRVLTETRAGITTIYGYDGSGRVKTVTRRGTDNSEMVTETNTYDLAGRKTSSKDALNNQTDYVMSFDGSGRSVTTATLPGGSTRVETIHKDGRPKEINGSAPHPLKYEYGTASGGQQFVKEIKVGIGGTETEWIKTYTDMAARPVKNEYADGAIEQTFYNNLGQKTKTVDPDGVTTVYAYNGKGELQEQGIDRNANGTLESTDRTVKTVKSVVNSNGTMIRTVTSEASESGYVTTLTVDESPNGRKQTVTRFGLVTTMETLYDGSGGSTRTTTLPDGSTLIEQYANGRLTSRQRKIGGTVIGSTTYQSDAHGRPWKAIDGRTNTQTVTTYYPTDWPQTETVGSMATSYQYNGLGQMTQATLPGNRTVIKTYQPTGEVLTVGGTAEYPVTYTYDPQGREKTMVTSSGTTTWTYSPQRGWLTQKTDAQNHTVNYTYKPSGRPWTRQWARGVTTTYGYNTTGDLTSTTYSDGTPLVTAIYDQRGHPITVTDAAGTHTLTYNAAGALATESITGGILSGVVTTNTFDNLLRRSGFIASRSGINLVASTLGYDGASRLQTVTSGSQNATYAYYANSSLVNTITHKQGATPVMTTTKTYDALDRLSSIGMASSAAGTQSYAYIYNSAGQRSQVTLENGHYVLYSYNNYGEVTSGSKKLNDGTNALGYQFGYTFDNIGNRTSTTINGRSATYTPNSINEYTQRIVPGYVNVVGRAHDASTITINAQAATRQAGGGYHRELSVNNSSAPVYLSTTVLGVRNGQSATRQGEVFVPQTPEIFAHDVDGNLTSDGRWTYTWDGENRLIGMETQASAVAAGAPKKRLTFKYDSVGRRISKKVENWNSTAYAPHYTMLFVWDGWNLAAEVLDSGLKVRSYVWGSDLSGGQGAGGIGGLLFIQQQAENKTYSVGFDGNGNVCRLYDMGASGALAATYEYGAFGELIVESGSYATVNPVRWSTKYTDNETELAYYAGPNGGRYYSTMLGRWLQPDRLGEAGGKNLYAFVHNNPISYVDPFGLREVVFRIASAPHVQGSQGGVASNLQDDFQRLLGYVPPYFDYPAPYPLVQQTHVNLWLDTFLKERKKVGKPCCNTFKLDLKYTATPDAVRRQLSGKADAYVIFGHGDTAYNGETGIKLTVGSIEITGGMTPVMVPVPLSQVFGGWNSPSGQIGVGVCKDAGLPKVVGKTSIIKLGRNTYGANLVGYFAGPFKNFLSQYCCDN